MVERLPVYCMLSCVLVLIARRHLQGAGGVSRGAAGGMPNGMAGADGSYISEDQYLRVWEQYSKMTGMPFDAQTVRGWYQQHRAAQAR